MAVNISTELYSIQNDELGEDVRRSVANALNKTKGTTDIARELTTISTSRYGAEIRGAIYDALKKISEAEQPTPSGVPAGYAVRRAVGTDLVTAGLAKFIGDTEE